MNCRVIPIVLDVSVDCSRLISQDDLPKYPFFLLGKDGSEDKVGLERTMYTSRYTRMGIGNPSEFIDVKWGIRPQASRSSECSR